MLITVEDSENRARVKLQRAVDEVKKLLVPMVSVALLSDYRKSKEVSKYTTCIAPKVSGESGHVDEDILGKVGS